MTDEMRVLLGLTDLWNRNTTELKAEQSPNLSVYKIHLVKVESITCRSERGRGGEEEKAA